MLKFPAPSKFIRTALFIEALIVLMSITESAEWIDRFQNMARYSGRLSLVCFATLFIFTLLHPKLEGEFFKNKVSYFKSFALIHFIHFCMLGAFQYLNEMPFNWSRAMGGMVAYSMILAFPFILAKHKSKLIFNFQYVYLLFVWSVFFITYLGRVKQSNPHVSGNINTYYILFPAVIFLGIIGAYLFVKSRTSENSSV